MSGWSFKSSPPFKKDDEVYLQGRLMNNSDYNQNYEKNYKEVLEIF